jgi:hypothetical protein
VVDLPLELSRPDPKSTYVLRFVDANGKELSRLPFPVDFHTRTAHGAVNLIPIYLAAPIPASAQKVEIVHTAVLYSLSFSAGAPRVSNVVATPKSIGYFMTWTAADPDQDRLRYSIYFKRDTASAPILLVGGLTTPSYLFDTGAAPNTTNGQIIVQASDGYNTASAASSALKIAARPPAVNIIAPASKALVSGQPIALSGLAHDFTNGPLHGAALAWRSDRDGKLGQGDQLEVRLSPGRHLLTLDATGPVPASGGQPLVGHAHVTVNVLSDSDHDGMTDSFEHAHPCLHVHKVDSAADPDGDGLPSLGEMQRGLDPCNPDSDTDGAGDGDEARLGSNPLDPKSTPSVNTFTVSDDSVDLGICPKPTPQVISVQVAAGTQWRVASNADWLKMSGGGTGSGKLTLSATCTGLAARRYIAHVLLTTTNGDARTVLVTLKG